MKLGVISDVHGNIVALEAVLRDLRKEKDVDEVVCCGDVVGVLGWPEETAHRIKQEVDHCVYGNHDAYVRDDYMFVPKRPSQKQEHRVVTSSLTEETLDWLNDLPETLTIDGDVVVAHADPFADERDEMVGYPANNYVDKRDWVGYASDKMDGKLVLFGHTHDQGGLDTTKFDGCDGTIVNPGSAGAPYYEDAKYAVVDTETHDFSLHRLFFDDSRITKKLSQLGVKPAKKLDRRKY
jgi:putative phosphoesterase